MVFDPATQTLDELRALPVPEFAERDTADIKRKLVSRFEDLSNRTLFPAQPEMFVIELMSYALSNFGSALQNGLIQNRAIWAEGRHLDELGANVGTFRLKAQFSRAEVEFTLSERRNSAVVIPLGTRVAAGSSLIFRTQEELVIPAGDTTGIVDTIAAATGTTYNELQLGQIQDVLDPIAYVSTVANVQISAGGSDPEDDARFRERIVNAFERITRGGSRQGYVELVKAAHPNIVDAKVIRPQPGHIHIFPLMTSGIAADAINDVIMDFLDPETTIPMGDYVSVHKVTQQNFDVVISLKVTPGSASEVTAQAEAAIRAQFAIWSQKLGVQIAPSAIVEAVRNVPGVVGVDGPAFDFTDLPDTHFAQLGALTVNVTEAPNV